MVHLRVPKHSPCILLLHGAYTVLLITEQNFQFVELRMISDYATGKKAGGSGRGLLYHTLNK